MPAGQRMEKQYNPLQNLQTTTTLDSRLTSDQNDYPMRRLSEVPDSPAGAVDCTMPWLEAWGSSSGFLQPMALPIGTMGSFREFMDPAAVCSTRDPCSCLHLLYAEASFHQPAALQEACAAPRRLVSIGSTLRAAGFAAAAQQEGQALGGAAQHFSSGSSSHAAEGPDAQQHGADPCTDTMQLDRPLAVPALRQELLHTAAVAEPTVISESEAAEQLMAALPSSMSTVAAGRTDYQPDQEAVICTDRNATAARPGRLQRHRAGSDALSEAARGFKAAAARQSAVQRHRQQQDQGTSGPAAADAAPSSVGAPEHTSTSQASRSFVGVLRGLTGSWGRHSRSNGPADDGGGTPEDPRTPGVLADEPRPLHL